jgi:hypothetical protein
MGQKRDLTNFIVAVCCISTRMNSIIVYRRHLHRLGRFQRYGAIRSSIAPRLEFQPFGLAAAAGNNYPRNKSTRFFSASPLPVDRVVGSILRNLNEDSIPYVDDDSDVDESDENDEDKLDSRTHKKESHVSPFYKIAIAQSPSQGLNMYYTTRYEIANLKKCFETEFCTKSKYWTAAFVCPISGNRHVSGRLSDKDYVRDDKVYYTTKKQAINAAAAKALDSIHYNTFDVLIPRLCRERPVREKQQQQQQQQEAVVDDTTTSESKNDQAMGIKNKVQLETTKATMENTEIMKASSVEAKVAADKSELNVANDISTEPAVDDDELYAITDIPTTLGKSAANVLLESICFSNVADFAVESRSRLPIAQGPTERLLLAIDVALGYINVNHKNGTNQQTPAPYINSRRVLLPNSGKPATSGKAVLRLLADAYQSFPIGDEFANPNFDVEFKASRVLDIMYSGNVETPDIEDFNNYIKCIDCPSHSAVAMHAEATVHAMEHGISWSGEKSHVPPKPNVETYNILIQIWAQMGGSLGRYNNVADSFVPNRESFLALLSSCTYLLLSTSNDTQKKGGFDLDFARECIKRMKELADENKDATLRPDIHVYNAPLRWAGGCLAPVTRPYARATPWDRYDHLFDLGIVDADANSDLLKPVFDMEAWLVDMLKDGVDPDIITFEALLQAWLRTSTRRGLDRAHEIALDLLQDSHQSIGPRLQTFRPVALAWMLSKESDAPLKVQQLIEQLHIASSSLPDIAPDARMFEILLSSYAEENTADLDRADEVAQNCTIIIEKLCSDIQQTASDDSDMGTFLEVTSFLHAMHAWRNVAATADSELVDKAGNSMLTVVRAFESTVHALIKREFSDGVGLKSTLQPSLQLRHLLMHACYVYGAFASSIKEIDEIKHNSRLRLKYLLDVEGMVRKSAEIDAAASRLRSSRERYTRDSPLGSAAFDKDKLLYDDYITFSCIPTDNRGRRKYDSSDRNAYLNHVLDYLKGMNIDKPSRGDFSRLCALIDETKSQLQQLRSTSDASTPSIDDLIRVPQIGEKEASQSVFKDTGLAKKNYQAAQFRRQQRQQSRQKRATKKSKPSSTLKKEHPMRNNASTPRRNHIFIK